MQGNPLDQIHEGQTVCDREGRQIGTIAEVHPQAPAGSMAPGIGYVKIHANLPDRTRDIELPVTSVLDVRPDCVVVELDRDLVAAHNQAVRPEKLSENLSAQQGSSSQQHRGGSQSSH